MGLGIQKRDIIPGLKGGQTNKPTITASCYVCREVCTGFMETREKDTEIRPGIKERRSLEKMMPNLSFETQIGVSFQMKREEISTSFLLVYFNIIF